ncbi:MAG TPA: right-handed parallel beta-helix repeat-containing protein, partial [Prolixibacteraceae bacterium]|nr:right-handed parallel beta-helix repeat-containing protein [Prolixibacteraceae bacterium]
QYQVPRIDELYVDAVNGDDVNNGHSSDSPLRTIQRAAEKAGPGTHIFINPGIYNEQVVVPWSGEAGTPIEFTANGTDSVIIDGQSIATDGNGSFFQISRLAHIRVSGIHVRNTDASGIYAYKSNDIHIENCSTFNTFSSGIKARDCDELLIRGNDVRLACNGGGEECLTVASCTNFEVSHNTVHEGPGLYLGGEGICIKGNGGTGSVHHNRVFDLPANYDPAVHEDGEVGIYVGAYSESNYLHNVDVYANVSTTPVGIAVSSEEGGHTDRIGIFNNLVYNCYSTGIEITNWVVPNTGPKTNIWIENNTVVNCGHHTSGGWPVGQGIFIESKHPDDDNYIIRNNIVGNCLEFQIRVCAEALPHTVINHNLLQGWLATSPEDVTGSDSVLADPLFVDAGSGDYRLYGTSPAVDTGNNNAGSGEFDIRDEARLQNNGIDIGAHEWTLGLDPGPVNTNLDIENLRLDTGDIRCYDAASTITIPENGTTASLGSGSSTVFIAGQAIRFLPGFRAETGCDMLASITSTGNFCDLGWTEQESTLANEKSKTALNPNMLLSRTIQPDIRLFPNPGYGRFFLKGDKVLSETTVSVYHSDGSRIYQQIFSSCGSFEVELTVPGNGIYFVKIVSNKQQLVKKIISIQ